MSCDNATAPIDLTKNTDSVCNLKCAYSINYSPTSLRITNKGRYLSFLTDDASSPPVTYNDENYNVKEVRLYTKSIHTWSGQQADAELIISHTSVKSSNKLLVCIPIVQSSTTTSDSALFFDFIMAETQRTATSQGQQTSYNNPTLTLGKFIPLKPYYSYSGTLPWFPCNGVYSYVVFSKSDAITMSPDAYRAMQALIPTPNNIRTTGNNTGSVYYNPKGPTKPNVGEIYIDCQPTGDDGEILVPAILESVGLLDNELLKKLFNSAIVKLLVGVLVMLLIWKMAMKAIDGIASHASKAASAAINNAGKIPL